MAHLVRQCPHCLAEKMALRIVSQSFGPGGANGRSFLHLQCPSCGLPSAAEAAEPHGGRLHDVNLMPFGIEQHGWSIVAIWPEPPKPRIPDHLPDAVVRAYLMAERNFSQDGMEEASAGSYGRALDIGTKLFAPDLAGLTLFARIKKLAEEHRITPQLAEWADAIRLLRNEALHDIESVSRDDLVAMRGFSEMVLTYLFTLPGMLAARQAQATPKG